MNNKKLVQSFKKITAHDHLCLFYNSREEQMNTVIPFITTGLDGGEKLLYIAGETPLTDLLHIFKRNGLDADLLISSGDMVIAKKEDFYTDKGFFSPDRMTAFLKDMAYKANSKGCRSLRAAIEMTYQLDSDTNLKQLPEYESIINDVLREYDILGLCMYDKNLFSSKVIEKMFYTHPVIIFDQTVCNNFFYIPREEYHKNKNSSHSIDRLLNNLKDVEKHKNCLWQSKERYRQLLKLAHEGILAVDENAQITFINPCMEKIMGYEIKDMLKKHFSLFIAETAKESYEYFLKRCKKGLTEHENLEIIRKDKTLIKTAVRAAPINDQDGRCSGVIFMITDITDRRRIEDALIESETRFQYVTQYTGQWIWETDADGKFIYSNSAVEQVLGYNPEEIIGKYFYDFFPQNEQVPLKKKMEEIYCQRQAFKNIANIKIHKNGQLIFCETSGSPVLNTEGEFIGYRGVVHDCTNRTKYEEKLKKAKEAAEHATLLKDKFISLVAHDIRGPSGSIASLIQLLLKNNKSPFSERDREILEAIFKSATKITNFVKDVLDISRMKTGKIKLSQKYAYLKTIIKRAMESLEHVASQKRIKIINTVPNECRFFVDETLYCQVIENLLHNAIKFSNNDSEISIFIPDNTPSTIAVSDFGIGINPKLLKKIFSYEIKTSTTGTAGETGTGLGLPLSREIMLAHKGELTVESEEKKGSTFYAKLSLSKPTVLIIDDEEIFRLEQKHHLREIELDILEADNGEDALHIIESKKPHLIIADINLPIIDGFELLKKVRENPETSDIPVIVVTGLTGMEIKDKAFECGADDFVQKPFEPEELIPRVKRFVG